MPRTGFIDHIGIGVPDLVEAKRYYDDLMPILGLRPWFPTTASGEFNYGPDGVLGPQVLLLSSARARRALTARDGPSAPVVHGRQPSHRPRGVRVGDGPSRRHRACTSRLPRVRGPLRHLLPRPAWLHARSRLPQSRRALTTLPGDVSSEPWRRHAETGPGAELATIRSPDKATCACRSGHHRRHGEVRRCRTRRDLGSSLSASRRTIRSGKRASGRNALGWDVGDEGDADVALVPTDGTRFDVAVRPPAVRRRDPIASTST